MKDILIYTTPKVLEHKKTDGLVYWQFSRMPKHLPDRMYFAINKQIVGYFRVADCLEAEQQIEWFSDTWVELKQPVPVKPFQGFKYIKRIRE